MSEETAGLAPDLIELAGGIVGAYVSNNSVPVSELPALIASVHRALVAIANSSGAAALETAVEEVEKPTPAQIRKSITDQGLISFVDGKSYKTLKRHLTAQGLNPHSYRERYGLPADYPMVASGYAAQRSALARQIGLGRLGTEAKREPEPEPAQGGGRRRKAA